MEDPAAALEAARELKSDPRPMEEAQEPLGAYKYRRRTSFGGTLWQNDMGAISAGELIFRSVARKVPMRHLGVRVGLWY